MIDQDYTIDPLAGEARTMRLPPALGRRHPSWARTRGGGALPSPALSPPVPPSIGRPLRSSPGAGPISPPAPPTPVASPATNASTPLCPHALYRWVRWAALPSVYELTAQSARTYLQDGVSGVVFVEGSTAKQRAYVLKRLRRVAGRLDRLGAHGVWLLWADRDHRVHDRLREQLGLAVAGAPSHSSLAHGEFAIVVMAGSRVKETYVMREPFSFDAVQDFCLRYHQRVLWPEGWARELHERRHLVGGMLLAAAAIAWWSALYRKAKGRHSSGSRSSDGETSGHVHQGRNVVAVPTPMAMKTKDD